MSNLTQERIKKPVSDDMSMDEILASIRKIISSDDDSSRQNTDTHNMTRDQQQSEQKFNNTSRSSMSAREQLLSLTRTHAHDINSELDDLYNTHDIRANTYPEKTPSVSATKNPETRTPTYEKLAVHNKIHGDHSVSPHTSYKSDDAHDADILRTLNQIRQSLHIDSPNIASNIASNHERSEQAHLRKMQTSPVNHDKPIDPVVKMTKREIIKPNIRETQVIQDIDLRPAQFSADDVPQFLKKFRKQQLDDRTVKENNISSAYDFSALPKFDEDQEIMPLTNRVMPSQSHNTDDLRSDNSHNSIRKLKKGTEEIMRRATERSLLGDDIDEDIPNMQQEDIPLSNLLTKTMKPMIAAWIDENMEDIAKQVLRQELRRGLK